MHRKRLTTAAASLIALIVVAIISFAYSRFAAQQILSGSVVHLEEVYGQINAAFCSTITNNWKLLRSWAPYVAGTAEENPREFAGFLAAEQEDWHFTTFYFLAEDGSCLTADGTTVRLELGADLNTLMEARENIAVSTTRSDGRRITLFAVPVEPGRWQGFDYGAIGFGCDGDDMTEVLSIDAFSGQSHCFIVSADGRILFSSRDEEPAGNLLTWLDGNVSFPEQSWEDVAQSWQAGEQRVVVCDLDGVPHYLSYQPVGFSDWMLMSITPVDVVNAGMDHFAFVTLAVMALIFGLLAVGVVVSIVLNDRRRMWEKNREISSRESLFNLLTENTDDIFLLFSPEHFEVEYISPNLERVLGLKPEEVRRDVCPLLFGDPGRPFPDDRPPLSPEVLSAIPMGGVWTGERDILHAKTHELRWFKQLLHRCSLEQQERFILMLSDRTKERQMNEALGEALHTARAANEAKSNFLANMSHDIRTPMNAIVGFSVLLNRDAEHPDKVREYTRKIAASSQHLLSLINDVLDMSKIESGSTSLNMSQFSLPELMDELYTMMLPQARAKGQSFELYTRGSLPELLLGDKLRLNQVLLNLLSNAVKYTQPGGQITMTVQGLESAAARRARLRFTVADNGFGMSTGFLQTLFEPFSREVTDDTREIQGTGLGMAITKNIVDLMGGTISVESEPEQGTVFTVELELAVACRQEDSAFWRHHSITRLLVVDDEEDVCQNVRSAMEGTGVEISCALSGASAVELAAGAHGEGRDFHVILLDWKMPGMDGIETARRIRRKVGDEVPILVLTAFDLEEAREAGKDTGIDMFLPKPFFLSNFQRAMTQLLEGKSACDTPAFREEISLDGLKVLAAEDNEINAEILLELLEMEGVRCEVVSNGEKAVERFARSEPGEFDLIFMDVQMPVMDGYDATRAIRAGGHPQAKTIPIIAMTANAFEEDVRTALSAGMNAHTAKPIDMDQLKDVIARLNLSWSRPAPSGQTGADGRPSVP